MKYHIASSTVSRVRRDLVGAMLTVLTLACADDPTEPRLPFSPQAAMSGCYDATDPQCNSIPPAGDPDPNAYGIYLDTAYYTPEKCTGTNINDGDRDRTDEMCEFQLALSFRPLLVADPFDEDLRRQSYWAARWVGGVGPEEGWMEIIYMLGYLFDNGNTHSTACDLVPQECHGHFGDSEFIIARVYFDYVTKHWKLSSVILSAHYKEWDYPCTNPYGGGEFQCDYTSHVSAVSLSYPSKYLHYPRVFVSLNKHANYHSRSACNSGGAFQSDDCTHAADYQRVSVNRHYNAGSAAYPFIQATQSWINPTVYSGTEYIFHNNTGFVPFCGWDGPSTSTGNRSNCSTSYEEILADFGFGGTSIPF